MAENNNKKNSFCAENGDQSMWVLTIFIENDC